MAGTLTVRITQSAGEILDFRYRLIWSAHLDGRLLGQGHAFQPEEAEQRALDLVSPEEVEHIDIIYRGRQRSDS